MRPTHRDASTTAVRNACAAPHNANVGAYRQSHVLRLVRSMPCRLKPRKSPCYTENMNDKNTYSPFHLDDVQLLAEVKRLAECERVATARLVALLAEFDARKLYLGEGCSSLFTYCTQALHLSEHAAYGRIEAARAARRFPIILELLEDGAITLTAVGLLSPHLTPENHRELLQSARHRTKRDVEGIVSALRPQPAVPATIRKLPSPPQMTACRNHTDACPPLLDAALPVAAPAKPAVVTSLAPQRYKLQLTLEQGTHDKLRRVQDLLRHSIPNGDPAAIFDRALTLLLAQLERRKCAATDRPRQTSEPARRSRHIPASVKRTVWSRDEGRCAFVGADGRCTERGFLEFHHVQPYAADGATTIANVELRCRAHNQYEANLFFRDPLIARESRPTFVIDPGPAPLCQIAYTAGSRSRRQA